MPRRLRPPRAWQLPETAPLPQGQAAALETALDAFQRNGFFVLVDDRQVEGLDEEIEIRLNTTISFVKLVPLVGG